MTKFPFARPALIVAGILLASGAAQAGEGQTVTIKNCTSDTMDIITVLVENEDSDTPQRKHFALHQTVSSKHSVTVKVPTRRLTIEAKQGVIAPPTTWTAVTAQDYGIYFKGRANRYGHYRGHELAPLKRGLCDGKS